MFNHVGSKLKAVAVVFCILGIVLSIAMSSGVGSALDSILDPYGHSNGATGAGITLAMSAFGILLSIVGAMLLYAYGEITDSVTVLADIAAKNELAKMQKTNAPTAAAKTASAEDIPEPKPEP